MKFYIFFILFTVFFLYIVSENKNRFNNFHINITDFEKCDLRYTLLPKSSVNNCTSTTTPPEFLLSNTQVTNVKNSLLSWTVIFNCDHIFLYLLENGADVNNACYSGFDHTFTGHTPLYYALSLKRYNYILPLLNSGASLEYKNGYYVNDILHNTESYFDIAIYMHNTKGFCELYKYIISPVGESQRDEMSSQKNNYKSKFVNILDRSGIDFKLSFYQDCGSYLKK